MTKNEPVKPVVKWVGGKRQLLPEIRSRYPVGLGSDITQYMEPFLGGGAVMIDVLSNYNMSEVHVSDMNRELINMYCVVKTNPYDLISILKRREKEYNPQDHSTRSEIYYNTRKEYNHLLIEGYDIPNPEMAAMFIFLNKTCFNGLYRVNLKGEFNAPVGKYKSPAICEEDNLYKVKSILQNVTLYHRDYTDAFRDVDDKTFIYLDPPYRPIATGSDFTSYTRSRFNDDDHRELADMLHKIDKRGGKFMLSNSDPKNHDESDEFFDELYSCYNIERVGAVRRVNTDGTGRGSVSELLVTNYTDYITDDKQQTNIEDFK